MIHNKVIKTSLGDIKTEFSHDPDDEQLSVQEFLDDQFADGWSFAGVFPRAGDSTYFFVFVPNGRNS